MRKLKDYKHTPYKKIKIIKQGLAGVYKIKYAKFKNIFCKLLFPFVAFMPTQSSYRKSILSFFDGTRESENRVAKYVIL